MSREDRDTLEVLHMRLQHVASTLDMVEGSMLDTMERTVISGAASTLCEQREALGKLLGFVRSGEGRT